MRDLFDAVSVKKKKKKKKKKTMSIVRMINDLVVNKKSKFSHNPFE